MTDLPGSTPIVGVVGCGVTGSRVMALLAQQHVRVAVYDVVRAVALAAARPLGAVVVDQVDDLEVCDAVVLCHPAPHLDLAVQLLERGTPAVSIGDDLGDLSHLIAVHERAVQAGVPVVIGAGMAPGVSGLLARYLAAQLHQLDELHVAIHGTAGPSCARQHHDALGDTALGWHDGAWIEPPGGSGRDLVWFPEPVGAHDCYRAALGDPLLLQRSFPTVDRVSARVSATRRDRLTARLPMLTPPHATGGLGSVRVEARGALEGGERVTVIAGTSGTTAELSAYAAVATATRLLAVPVGGGVFSLGDAGLEGLDLLHQATSLGLRVQEFTGVGRATSW